MLALRWLLPKPAPSMDGVDVARDLDGCALIIGFGRFGQIVTQAMLARGIKVSILTPTRTPSGPPPNGA